MKVRLLAGVPRIIGLALLVTLAAGAQGVQPAVASPFPQYHTGG